VLSLTSKDVWKADKLQLAGEKAAFCLAVRRSLCICMFVYFLFSSAGAWWSGPQGPAASPDRWQAEPKCWHHRQLPRVFLCNAGIGCATEE